MEQTHPQNPGPKTISSDSPDDDGPLFSSNPWKENHGNLLLAFTAIVCLFGSTILACRQMRFEAPRFPSSLSPNGKGEEGELNGPSGELMDDTMREVGVTILGAGSDAGNMRLAIYTSPEGFTDPEKAFDTAQWQIRNGICDGKLRMPKTLKEMAIAVYHDENDNGVLDRNPLGIPSERYGFSGDARGLTGPPPFEDAVIEVSDSKIQISIR